MYWEKRENKHFIRIAGVDLIKLMYMPKGTALNKENVWFISVLNSDEIRTVKGEEHDLPQIKRFAIKEFKKKMELIRKVHITTSDFENEV